MALIKLSIDGVEYACTPVPSPVSKTGLRLVPVSADPTVIVAPLDALATWVGEYDGATQGSANGSTTYPVLIGGRQARKFTSSFTDNGGFRFHTVYGTDTVKKNFVYAGDLYFQAVAGLGQMELDNNQVTADGQTYIYGCQCNANSGAWDITKTIQPVPPAKEGNCAWVPTAFKGSPQRFALNRWLHFEIASHRDDAGNITYDAIFFDGVTALIGTTLPASLSLGWEQGIMLVNFQLGGAGASGNLTAYANNLQVARW